MFVSAISSKGVDMSKIGDVLAGNSIGDLSPAIFRVDFDEPIELKNCDIELVSCKISKKNEIVVDAGNNLLSVRMGSYLCAEQYTAKLPFGTYTADTLAINIAFSLNEIMPDNLLKGWSCAAIAVSGILKLTWTQANAATLAPPSKFQAQAKNDTELIETGLFYPDRSDDGDYVKYECSTAYLKQMDNPVKVPKSKNKELVKYFPN